MGFSIIWKYIVASIKEIHPHQFLYIVTRLQHCISAETRIKSENED